MNKSLYIVAFSLAFATTGIAQNNEGQDKTVDLGTQTTTELRKTQAVSTIYSDELDKNATTGEKLGESVCHRNAEHHEEIPRYYRQRQHHLTAQKG